MGYTTRNDEIRDNVTRMRQEWEAQRGALTTVRRFNATLSGPTQTESDTVSTQKYFAQLHAANFSRRTSMSLACF
jgi:hypothetical protein